MRFKLITICVLLLSCNNLDAGLWPKGKIPFLLIGDFSDSEKENIRSAMLKWELAARCNVQFIDLSFTKYEGSNAPLIISDFAPENVNFTLSCGYSESGNAIGLSLVSERVMLHELGHALGLIDEQCRPDRDMFVHVCWENIPSQYWFGFDYQYPITYDFNAFLYDYTSIMHYDKGPWTDTDREMGNSDLSAIDVLKIQKIY